LLNQDLACRRYCRQRLHRGVEACYIDTAGSGRRGFQALLGHLSLCHNRNVVVARLDRVPARRASSIAGLGARVLSAAEGLPRTVKRQQEFFQDRASGSHNSKFSNKRRFNHV
jgi:hypothetical protein